LFATKISISAEKINKSSLDGVDIFPSIFSILFRQLDIVSLQNDKIHVAD
jgi:hypothetical protein